MHESLLRPGSNTLCVCWLSPTIYLTVDYLSRFRSGGGESCSWTKVWRATIDFFYTKHWISFFLSASSPHLMSSFIFHNSQESVNCCRLALHCMQWYQAIDYFPSTMAWNAKSPVTKTSVMEMWPGVTFKLGSWYSMRSTPLSTSVNKCNWNVEMISTEV